jgi:hypothetical protein
MRLSVREDRVPAPCPRQRFARIFDIGGEEDVEGRPVADLREEIADNRKRCPVAPLGEKLEPRHDVLHGEVQVRGGSDVDFADGAAPRKRGI